MVIVFQRIFFFFFLIGEALDVLRLMGLDDFMGFLGWDSYFGCGLGESVFRMNLPEIPPL